MIFLAHINVPGPAFERMFGRFGMDHSDIAKALEMYNERILGNWDDGVITFNQFLEEDLVGAKEFTNKK